MDLSLVPISELFDEIAKRSDFYVGAYQLTNEPTKIVHTHWKDRAWFGNLALTTVLQADLLQESYDSREKIDDKEI